jgi:predicted transporter
VRIRPKQFIFVQYYPQKSKFDTSQSTFVHCVRPCPVALLHSTATQRKMLLQLIWQPQMIKSFILSLHETKRS